MPRRNLLVMIWAVQKGNRNSTPSYEDYKLAAIAGRGPSDMDNSYGMENCLGVVEVAIEKILNQQLVVGWYRLFTPDSYQLDSDSK